MLSVVHFGKNVTCVVKGVATRVHDEHNTRFDVTKLISLTGLYATGGAVTVVATNPVTGRVDSGFRVPPGHDTDVLSAFSYLIRKIVPCNTRVLVTTKVSRISPLLVVGCLCCPLVLNVYSALTVTLTPKKAREQKGH